MDWNNKKDVLKAVKKNGRDLQYASEELKADKEVVLEAVKENGWALQYASEELKADKEVAIETVKQNELASMYASESLKEDEEIITIMEDTKQRVKLKEKRFLIILLLINLLFICLLLFALYLIIKEIRQDYRPQFKEPDLQNFSNVEIVDFEYVQGDLGKIIYLQKNWKALENEDSTQEKSIQLHEDSSKTQDFKQEVKEETKMMRTNTLYTYDEFIGFLNQKRYHNIELIIFFFVILFLIIISTKFFLILLFN